MRAPRLIPYCRQRSSRGPSGRARRQLGAGDRFV